MRETGVAKKAVRARDTAIFQLSKNGGPKLRSILGEEDRAPGQNLQCDFGHRGNRLTSQGYLDPVRGFDEAPGLLLMHAVVLVGVIPGLENFEEV
jgi:hypothetical protein